MSSVVLGIRLGSESTSLALSTVSQDGTASAPDVIANEDGDRIIPTCVAFHGSDVTIGNIAKAQLVRNPQNVIVSFLELLGLPAEDALVQEHQRKYAVSLEASDDGPIAYRVDRDGKESVLTVEDVTAFFLAALLRTAENVCGSTIHRVAITVPMHYSAAQQNALRKAAKLAKISKVHFVVEPAAILAGLGDILPNVPTPEANGHRSWQPKHVQSLPEDVDYLIVDMGGRSTDVAAIAVRSGIATVCATARDVSLGGHALDELLVKYFAQEFYRKTRLDVLENRRATAKLRLACERMKRTLSSSQVAPISIESLYEGVDFNGNINRTRFEMLCGNFVKQLEGLLRKTLAEAQWNDGVAEVLLVGGCSRFPCFQAAVAKIAPGFTSRRHQQADPLELASVGAISEAIAFASATAGKPLRELEAILMEKPALSKSIGYMREGEFQVLVKQMHPLPVHRMFDVDPSSSVLAIVQQDEPNVVLASLDLEGCTRISITISATGDLELCRSANQ